MMYFSATTMGFYRIDIHGNNMPEDAIKITDDEYQTFRQGQANGLVLKAQDGRPVMVEPTITEDDIRVVRNGLLSESDWTQIADSPVDKDAWATYRQELRDVPSQAGFPENVTWPTKP